MTTTKQSWLKRSLAVLLAVIMVMSMGVANVFAAGDTDDDSGSTPAPSYLTEPGEGSVMSLTAGDNTYYFDDVASAFAAVDDTAITGDVTLKVLKDLTINEGIEIKGGVQSTLDLNGKTITVSENVSLVSGKLLLTDTDVGGSGKVTITGSYAFDVTASDGEAELAVQDCTIEGERAALKVTGENAALHIGTGADISSERNAVINIQTVLLK